MLRPYTIVPALAVSGGGYGWREDATPELYATVLQSLQTIELERVNRGRGLDLVVLLQLWVETLREGICGNFVRDW